MVDKTEVLSTEKKDREENRVDVLKKMDLKRAVE